MKRILFALAIFALVLPALRPAEAGVDVSVDFFYNNLGDDGSWVEVGDYGYCWQPNVAASNHDWRPYSDGYWAYTDVGWTWVSNEKFGWATYHYGRWARDREQGWFWVPGREWGPAWVSWRTGGDYVGWAPLPPRRSSGGGEVVYEGRPIGGQVDLEFDIGPSYYNFVDIRYIGGQRLRDRIIAPTENVTYINRTVNVTNITYTNSTVYNYGPDYNRLSAYSTEPIQRLSLQRETNADLNAAARSGGLTRVQGNTLMVAAPREFQRAEKSAAPRVVKAKIAKANLETGWRNVSDPKAKAELQKKMKAEDAKSVPPPDMKPHNPDALKASSPATAPATAPSPATAPATTVVPAAASRNPNAPSASAAPTAKGKDNGRGKKADKSKQSSVPSAAPRSESTPASDAVAPKADKKGKRPQPNPKEIRGSSALPQKEAKKNNDKVSSAAPVNAPGASTEPAAKNGRGQKKNEKSAAIAPTARPIKAPTAEKKIARSAPAAPKASGNDSQKSNRKSERAPVKPAAKPKVESAPAKREQPASRQDAKAAPPARAPGKAPATAPAAKGKPDKASKGKDKKSDEKAPK
ncbi:MAG TPA: DUF6600 domain-containing protein [Chthoniobacterales bacterium]|nr:DUF6600 domain-containing protein [Chthoniobacterales bacterium]